MLACSPMMVLRSSLWYNAQRLLTVYTLELPLGGLVTSHYFTVREVMHMVKWSELFMFGLFVIALVTLLIR